MQHDIWIRELGIGYDRFQEEEVRWPTKAQYDKVVIVSCLTMIYSHLTSSRQRLERSCYVEILV